MSNSDSAPVGLSHLSSEIQATVARAAESIVRVEDGSRLTATGIVWSADGTVITTSHGVERDEDLAIELADGTLLPASLVGRDPDTDIAVLKVQHAGLIPISRLDTDTANIGTLVLTLARPGRSGLQATLGIISARTETQTSGRDEYLLHTDADMYPGFSGGSLVDVQGNLLGMTNLMFGRGRGIALGTPILAHVSQALLANGRVQRGYLGVRTQQVNIPEGVRDRLPWPVTRGLLIAQVEPGSPADTAGLLLGDTLLRLAETVISDVETLRGLLRANPPGSDVVVDYLRGGDVGQLVVTLGVE